MRTSRARLDPPTRRLLRWAAVRGTVRVGTVLLALVLIGQTILTWRDVDRVAISAPVPDLARLDEAIDQAEGYVDRLYQQIADDKSVVSEYSGLPLTAYFPTLDTWVSPGGPALQITSGEQSRERETYVFQYSLPDLRTLDLLVVLRWEAATPGGLLEVSQVGGDEIPVRLMLGELTIARWVVGAQRQTSQRLRTDQLGELRSLRYTVRHVAMLAASFYRYRQQPDRAARLTRLADEASYDSGGDVYSPLWGDSAGRPDDYLYSAAVYPDCQPGALAALPTSKSYYPYQSKVCALPSWGYIAMTREDPLVTTMQAVHVLREKAAPDAEFSDGEHFDLTPIIVAADLEHRYRTEVGIGTCLPGTCTTDNASTLRTALLGLLETELGFGHGDDVSRGYADAVIDDLLRVQVQPDGVIHSVRLGDLHRPSQAGGFYTAYDDAYRSGSPDNLSRQQIDLIARRLDIRREYLGELATNAETTLVVHAVLVTYRCARFRVGCDGLVGRAFSSPRPAAEAEQGELCEPVDVAPPPEAEQGELCEPVDEAA